MREMQVLLVVLLYVRASRSTTVATTGGPCCEAAAAETEHVKLTVVNQLGCSTATPSDLIECNSPVVQSSLSLELSEVYTVRQRGFEGTKLIMLQSCFMHMRKMLQ